MTFVLPALVALLTLPFLLEGLLRLFLMLASRLPPPSPLPPPPSSLPLSLALLIPAHDEAAVIGEAVAAARADLGPQDALFVIADNCSDHTAALARRAGAATLTRAAPGDPGKGAALRWALAQPELAAFTALVVLDADTRIHPGFCDGLRAALAAGADAAQAFVHPVGVEGSPASALAGYSELLSQTFDEQARFNLGWPLRLRGTGMAFRAGVFAALAPRLRTKVEDSELSLLLAVEGCRSAFVPGAVLDDPKPDDAALVAAQRARWLQGERDLRRLYRAEIGALLLRGPAGWSLAQAVLLKPKTLFLALRLLLLTLTCALAPFVSLLPFALLLISLTPDLLYYTLGLLTVPDRGLYARALLRAPLYLPVWVWGLVLSRLSRTYWTSVRHGKRNPR